MLFSGSVEQGFSKQMNYRKQGGFVSRFVYDIHFYFCSPKSRCMRKFLLSLVVTLSLTVTSSGQITLSQSSYPVSVVGTDSIASTTVASFIPILTPTTNAIWDLTTITDSTVPSFIYRVASITYPFADSNFYDFAGYSYQENVECDIASLGYFEYYSAIPRAATYIGSITHGPTDSFVIVPQFDTFSSAHIVISFPATYENNWFSSYKSDFNYQISIAAFSYNHAPGIVRSYMSETDSVTGWGEMRVKNLDGIPSSYFNVLQVKKIVSKVDSFFLNGTLATDLLLTTLGLTQGQTTTTYLQDYYRTGEVTPMAEVTYSDATFSHPVHAATHIQRLVNEGVANVDGKSEVKVFPNPATGTMTIELPFTPGTWSFELSDFTGQIIRSGTLTLNGSIAQFTLPQSMASGIYSLRLFNNNGFNCVKTIEAMKGH